MDYKWFVSCINSFGKSLPRLNPIKMALEMKYALCAFVVLSSLTTFELQGQAKVRKVSTIINHPSLNVYAPYISADANALVFLSDNAEDHALTPFFTFRENADWKEPQVLPKTVNTRLNFLRGYGLSADGGTLFFSTIKSPGVGGYDLWSSEWKGGSVWANPSNFGAPINSRLHEASASVTPDGKTMYFMRCEKMDQNRAEACKLFRVDKKSNGVWGEPVALPDHINLGNSQSPRIMADAQTLIFSSDKHGGKGGMDLYLTRLLNSTWSEPVALDFVNTLQDDQYVSVTGLGRYLVRDSPGARKNELVEYLIPDHLRPKGMMKVDGRVVGTDGKPLPAYISMVDKETGERIFNGRPGPDGSFLVYAMEGRKYELSIDPEHADKSWHSQEFDLTRQPLPQVQKVRAVLKPLAPGDELSLSGLQFRENDAALDMQASQRELQRLARVVTSNPNLKFEVEVLLEGYREDSVQSDPDLTEIAFDTVQWKYIDIDTLGQLYERDTISLKVRYHNDRTFQQVQTIIEHLLSKGAQQNNVSGFGSATPAVVPENRKTTIKARIVNM